MLAISPLKNDVESEMEKSIAVDFPDFSAGINLLDSIDFDDLFVGIGDGDLLPDLEMDPPHEINLAEFSVSAGEDSTSDVNVMCGGAQDLLSFDDEEEERVAISDLGSGSTSPSEEAASKTDAPKESEKGRKSTAKNPKRKVKVDWTPELHRRFVQAVEQLGVDKAVPSRILELMGIDCLTRHNIASHLQKYRSHRKHLLAREAEAASWSQRRQMYGGPAKRADHHHPWIVAPTMGFPPTTVQPIMPHFRPLHVWGHPSVDQSMMPMWHKHLATSSPHAWPPPHPPSADHPTYWMNPHHHHAPTPGMPYFTQHLPPTRFPTPGMFKAEQAGHVAPTAAQGQTAALSQPPSDVHPSKESVDAAIGDVLTKPWLPLPLGLKPPSVDSVVVELQRQGIPKIPPTCA